jgi:hypothetical protein
MMKNFNLIFLILFLSNCLIFGGIKKVPKGEKMVRILETAPIHGHHGSTPIIMPNTRNSGTFVLIDSSANGFGMSVPNSRPLYVDPENTGYWFSAYRQYCGEGTTHGQLGAAFSEDGESFETYYNVNSNGTPPWGGGGVGGTGVGQARYPSVVGTEDQPVAIWNEYTGNASDNNGSYMVVELIILMMNLDGVEVHLHTLLILIYYGWRIRKIIG